MRTLTWMAALALLLPLSSYGCKAAPAADPLSQVDGRLILENFPLEGIEGIDEQADTSQRIPGCAQVKSFDVYENNVPAQVIVALCSEGEFGPGAIDATMAGRVAQARATLAGMPAPVAALMLAGVDPVEVPLAGGNHGKALTIPAVGHGFVLLPLAYAVNARKDATILIQAFTNPNKPRNLNGPMATLLQAVYKSLQDKG